MGAPAIDTQASTGQAAQDSSDTLIDDDIRDIFIEEATEVVDALEEQFPAWRADPANAELRLEVRRAFHTLKGSGRMVKADCISELAWAVENLLNRITDGSLAPGAPLLDLVDEARGVMPRLIIAFRDGAGAPLDTGVLVRRAEALARGEPVAVRTAPAAVPATPPMTPDTLDEETMQQINQQLDAMATRIETLAGSVAQLQAGLAAVPEAPAVPAEAVKGLSQGLELAHNEIQALKLNLRNTADHLDAEARQVRAGLSQLQQVQDNGVAALRTSVESGLQVIRTAQQRDARAARTMATVAAAFALLGVGLALFLHLGH